MPARIAFILCAVSATLGVSPGCSLYDPELLEQRSEGLPAPDTGTHHDGGSFEDGSAADGGACLPNPSDPECPEICVEICNERDDDCDGAVDEEAVCTRDCVRQPDGARGYLFCETELSWEGARRACQIAGGELVHIRDDDENARVADEITAPSWIGHHRLDPQDVWVWSVNGVPIWQGDRAGMPVADRHVRWGDGQPANGACGYITPDGAFESAACSEPMPFACLLAPDGCADDPDKADPGQCGCGVPDTDSDGDDELDCDDTCPDDPDKNAPGVCGCGVPDTDSDGDNNPSCTDGCPDDPAKVAPGACGCGVPDTDSDGDGTPDCDDTCPDDATRVDDVDSDGDGALDCNDGCPGDPGVTSACFPFTPSNLDPRSLDFGAAPSASLNGCGDGTTTLTTSGSGATFDNWCGTPPTPVVQAQSGGPDIVVVPLRGLSVAAGHTLRLRGSQPVVFAVRGDVTLTGTIDASGSGTTPGAGGNRSCGDSQGGNGTGDTRRFDGASGGGGGGFGTSGGRGGTADTDGDDRPGGSGGDTRGSSQLTPLLGGCAGGRAGDCSTNGGGGGGAVQITASGLVRIEGALRANGAHGDRPCGGSDEGGGTGGGSGGAILVEANEVDTSGGTIQANGGNGGRNGNYAGIYDCGGSNGGSGATSPGQAGGNGRSCQGGGPGGGGGYGRIHIR